jgi:methionyl-tRNA formyltransferase
VDRKLIVATPMDRDSRTIQNLLNTGLVSAVVTTREALREITGERVLFVSWPHIAKRTFLDRQTEVLNVHNSLLPRYRGRHAFTWAMIHGEEAVGFTLHRVLEGIDTGPVYSQVTFPVLPDDDINAVIARGWDVLHDWLPDVLRRYCNGELTAKPQDHARATYFHPRTPEDGAIDWTRGGREIRNLVRAIRPPYTPGAYFRYGDAVWPVDRCEVIPSNRTVEPGIIFSADPGTRSCVIGCGDGSVRMFFTNEGWSAVSKALVQDSSLVLTGAEVRCDSVPRSNRADVVEVA